MKTEFEGIKINFRNPSWSLNTEGLDVFINCIGKAHDHKGTATEADYYKANYEIAKDIFEEFVKSEASLFIHISSIAAVEENEREELISEESVCRPVSYYGKSKRKAEEFLLGQQLPEGKKVLILRPSMIHGEGDKGNLTLLYKIISRGIPYPLGAFDNSRTFASVDNVVFLINEIIAQKDNMASGVYNICDDQPLSTRKIIEIIGKVRQSNPPVWKIPKSLINLMSKIGNVASLPLNSKRLGKMTSNLLVSNVKIKKALGINDLPLSAEQGMIKTIKSFTKSS
ncbi:NAD-dependent epimerase/dehydratase family protein [Chryseobacterium suipulveris]|uniref:NAD-dependent epimerase/dehydratase family protein n=1 Tax=Chryseobacterium suipulveris TaxID=2929800 RepID=A0ABY4BQT5_9FLAO|nr:NAD-dependent epimerase/dehydratase family protein [Chryseobacterium suipulveris]UOE41556.1 NAD-dependent epimerase/dehydratase family protein [Chryseobacterium suipulveris]